MSDEIKRRPASENPWYILMTIAGEQGLIFNGELHEKNRRFWHGWLAQGLDEEAKSDLIEREVVSADELVPFNEAESIYWKNEVERRGVGDVPDQNDGVNFSDCNFETRLSCKGFYFSSYADFESAAFSAEADFESAEFSGHADFTTAAFSDDANFGRAAFSGHVDFRSAVFSSNATFWSAAFLGNAKFRSTTFSSNALFGSTAFSVDADFGSAAFSGHAHFGSAVFLGNADFESASFSGNADFRKAKLSGDAHFESATFCKRTYFSETVFYSKIEFSNAVFQKRTTFHQAKFDREAPRFFGSNLHEDTDWTKAIWPKRFFKEEQSPTERRRAYERLKLLMDSQKKSHDEQMFHRLELRCREVEEGFPANIPSRLYRLVSDYGWSFMRPASFLFFFTCLGYWYFMDRLGRSGGCPAALGETLSECRLTVFSLSLSNMFGFLGLGRSVLKDEIEALDDFGWFEIGAGVQFFLGPILLFFLFLALRNRYRMR